MENVKMRDGTKNSSTRTLELFRLKNLRLKNEPKGRGTVFFSVKSGISVRLKTSVVTRWISLGEQDVTIP